MAAYRDRLKADLDRWIGADYEKGLGRLKSLAEKP